MVQSLLENRFQLKFHNQSGELPVYALVVGAGGTKLRDQGSPEDPTDPKGAREAAGYGDPNRVGGTYSDGDFLLTRDRQILRREADNGADG